MLLLVVLIAPLGSFAPVRGHLVVRSPGRSVVGRMLAPALPIRPAIVFPIWTGHLNPQSAWMSRSIRGYLSHAVATVPECTARRLTSAEPHPAAIDGEPRARIHVRRCA